MDCLLVGLYYDLIATTGSILAAIIAGIMPANIPILTQIEMANVNILPETKTGKSNTVDNNFAITVKDGIIQKIEIGTSE